MEGRGGGGEGDLAGVNARGLIPSAPFASGTSRPVTPTCHHDL